MKRIDKFNRKIAIMLSNVLSSMYFFWFCVLLDGLALWKQPPTDLGGWVTFVSQTVIQLLALSVLGFSGNLQSARMERKLNEAIREIKHILQIEETEAKVIKKGKSTKKG